MTIEAFLFDMDGLLIDSEGLYLEAAARAVTALGHPCGPEDFICWIGHSARAMAQGLAEQMKNGVTPEQIIALERQHFLEILHQLRPPPLPGVREMLDLCEELDLHRALVSSTLYPQAASTMAVILTHLGRTPRLEDHFGAVITGERVPRLKPAPDPYLEAARQLGVAPGRCLVFEDSPTGVRAGRAAGCQVVAIPNLYMSALEVSQEAHYSFPTLTEAFRARVWERF